MKGHEEYQELVAVYALGTLEDQERQKLESHLASGCDACESALREARLVADDLVHAIAPVAPSARVRERLLERVRQDAPRRTSSQRSRRGIWLPLATAASVALAIGLAFHVLSLRQIIEQERNARFELEERLARTQESIRAFTSPDIQTVSLAGQGPTPGAKARAFVDPANRRLFLYVYDLPAPPEGRTYQLWVIVDGTPMSVGTFGVDPSGNARLDSEPLPAFEGAVAVAVTEEPAGGVPQPTGPMVLLGS